MPVVNGYEYIFIIYISLKGSYLGTSVLIYCLNEIGRLSPGCRFRVLFKARKNALFHFTERRAPKSQIIHIL